MPEGKDTSGLGSDLSFLSFALSRLLDVDGRVDLEADDAPRRTGISTQSKSHRPLCPAVEREEDARVPTSLAPSVPALPLVLAFESASASAPALLFLLPLLSLAPPATGDASTLLRLSGRSGVVAGRSWATRLAGPVRANRCRARSTASVGELGAKSDESAAAAAASAAAVHGGGELLPVSCETRRLELGVAVGGVAGEGEESGGGPGDDGGARGWEWGCLRGVAVADAFVRGAEIPGDACFWWEGQCLCGGCMQRLG